MTASSGLVSIVMAAYNAAGSITRSIESIRHQQYTDWELWIVDDGSRDNTVDLIEPFIATDNRIHLVKQPNGGTAAARNNALTHCTGQWIAFLDADDRWLPTYLATAIDTLTRQANPVGVAYSWYYAVDEKDNLITLSPKYMLSGTVFHEVLERESLLLPSTTVMHASILKDAPQFLTEHIHEDREYFLRVCKTYPIYPMNQRLVLYQQSANGKCRALLKHYDKAVQAEMSIVDSVTHLLSPAECKALTHRQKRNLFYRFLMYNYMREARQLWGNAPLNALYRDKKGILAAFSLLTGISFLSLARVFIQAVVFRSIQPLWKQQLRQRMPLKALL